MGSTSTKFTKSDIPSQIGKTFLITGANAGIGYETAKQLALHGAHVIIAGRNSEKIQQAARELSEAVKSSKLGANAVIDTAVVDLSSLNSITKFAEDINQKYSKLDGIISNAGIFITPFTKTEEGFEVTLGTNAIGTTYLTNLLLPLVIKSESGRVVILSSSAVNFVSKSLFNTFINDVGGEKATDSSIELYGLSKLFNAFYARELQNIFDQKGYKNVIAISVHPGLVQTEIQSKTNKQFFLAHVFAAMTNLFGLKIEQGALSTLFAATSIEAVKYKGELIDQGPNITTLKTLPSAYTPENSKKSFEAMNNAIVSKGFPGFHLP